MGDGYVDGLVFVASVKGTTASGPRPVLLPAGPAGSRVGAWRLPDETVDETLHINPAHRAVDVHTGDGDDYIEGNGGDDTVFGGFGQDDIVGDSSDLYISGLLGQLVKIDNLPGEWRIVGVSSDGLTLSLVGRAAPGGRAAGWAARADDHGGRAGDHRHGHDHGDGPLLDDAQPRDRLARGRLLHRRGLQAGRRGPDLRRRRHRGRAQRRGRRHLRVRRLDRRRPGAATRATPTRSRATTRRSSGSSGRTARSRRRTRT